MTATITPQIEPGTYQGIVSGVAGRTYPPGMPLAPSTDGVLVPAQANATPSALCCGVLQLGAFIPQNNALVPTIVRQLGPLTLTVAQWQALTTEGSALTPSATYYVSDAEAGMITKTAPAAAGTYAAPIGFAVSATTLLMCCCQLPVGPAVTSPWDIDPTSGIAVPSSATQYNALLTAADVSTGGSGTNSIYGFQDAASPIVDATGLYNLAQVSANHAYRQAQAGWSRFAAQNIYTTVDNGFVKQGGTLPDPVTNSYLMQGWVALEAAPIADAGLMSVCNSAFYGGVKQTTLFPTMGSSAGELSRGSHALPSSGGFPIALQYDVTHKITRFFTPFEVLNKAYANTTGAEVDFGVAQASGLWAASAGYLWGELSIGNVAEHSVNDLGAIWTEAGWAPDWYVTPIRDPGGLYFPLAPNQWTALSLTAPGFAFAFSESAGLVFNDYCGDLGNPPLTKSGTNASSISLAQSVAGFTKLSIEITDGVASQVVSSTSDILPGLDSSSVALLLAVQINAAASGVSPFYSWVAGIGAGQVLSIHVQPSGILGLDVASAHVNGTVAQKGSQFYVLLVYDKTNARIVLYTPAEKIVAAYNAFGTTGQGLYFGSNSASVPAAGVNISEAAIFEGSAAEIQDTEARDILTSLGDTVLW